MKGRRLVTGLVATVAAASLVGWAAPHASAAPTAGVASQGTNPAGTVKALYSAAGFQALIDSVTAAVHAQYPEATFVDAVGTSPTGLTTSIRDVTTWQFNFNDTAAGRPILVRATVFLPDWTPTLTTVPDTAVLGQALGQPVALSPFQAALRLRLAGYREPFQRVTYAQPFGPQYVHPLFLLDQGAARVAVDTVTREVRPFPFSP